MKAATLRSFLEVHSWVGIVSGFFLFIAFYCGAITIFTDAVRRWEQPALRGGAVESLDRAEALARAMLAAHPDAADFRLTLPGERDPVAQIGWMPPAEPGKPRPDWQVLKLDANGQLVEDTPKSSLAGFVYRLHYTAGIPDRIGLYLFGVVCILYGLALVSGVILFLPVLAKDLFALRIGPNLKRLWQDAHNVIGTLSLPFHVVYAWTGAILALGVLLLAPFEVLVYGGKLRGLIGPDLQLIGAPAPSGQPGTPLPVTDLLAKAEAAVPGMTPNRLVFRRAGDAAGSVEVDGDLHGRSLGSSAQVALAAGTGAVIAARTPESTTPGNALLFSLYALHYATYGGLLLKWLYFLLGLAGAFMFYTGNLLWIEARRRRRQAEQPASGLWMARATLGVCIGCMAGVSACFLANKLLPAGLAERAAWEERSYFIVFFASIAWASMRSPAQAAVELLGLTALLTAAIPVANALVTGDHPLASALRGDFAVFGVDVAALVMAWAFWRMAAATKHRAHFGNPNSVWALRSSRAASAAAEPHAPAT